MREWVNSGVLAGLSAALAFWFAAGTVGVGCLTWKYRGRFANWWRLSPRDRADAILNISLFGILLNAAFQRIIATYAFAEGEWRLSNVTVITAPLYLVWSLVFMAGFLWWLCLETFGTDRSRAYWLILISSGVWLGLGFAWHFK